MVYHNVKKLLAAYPYEQVTLVWRFIRIMLFQIMYLSVWPREKKKLSEWWCTLLAFYAVIGDRQWSGYGFVLVSWLCSIANVDIFKKAQRFDTKVPLANTFVIDVAAKQL